MFRRGPATVLIALGCAAAADLRLIDAVKRRDGKSVESLVKGKAAVNAAQPDGATALAWAAHLDDIKSAELLLAAGADANTADEYGETPLTLACANGSAVLVEKLLKAGANPNAARWNGETALMIAAGAGSAESVKLLVGRGANLNAVEQRKGQNALMWAAAEGHTDAVEALIQLGADVKAKSTAGFTSLVFATIKDDGPSIARMVAAGADPNYTLPSGNSVLAVATGLKNVKAVGSLVVAGANPNIVDNTGATPLQVAASLGDVALVNDLLKKGATPDKKTPTAPAGRGGGGGGARRVIGQMTALHQAVNAKHVEAARALVAGGADPLLKAQEDTTLLMFAASSGNVATVRYVFENLDKRIDAVTTGGSTPMHAAVTGTLTVSTPKEIAEVIRYLAEKGAKLDEKDSLGRTPLQIATRSSNEAAVVLLTDLIKASPAPKPAL